MGSRFPEFDVWQEQANRDAQEEWAKTQEIQKMAYEAGGDMALLLRRLKAQIAEQEGERKRLEAEVAERERLLARRPSPRPMPGLPHGREARADNSSSRKPNRIGRNDPCPCGSGKKFKNCCLRT
jgi:preprotein translocase subunit SecA